MIPEALMAASAARKFRSALTGLVMLKSQNLNFINKNLGTNTVFLGIGVETEDFDRNTHIGSLIPPVATR